MSFLFSVGANIIGAFVGFGFAIMLQLRTEQKKRANTVNKVLLSIVEELTDISTSIQEYIRVKQPLTQRVPVPAWETALYSGIILELIDYKIYHSTIRAYSLIKVLNESIGSDTNKEDFFLLMKDIVDTSHEIIRDAQILIKK